MLWFVLEILNEGEQWRRCAFYTNKAFGFVTGAMYVNETEKGMSVKQVRERERAREREREREREGGDVQ